jgi:ubiquinone/menaquinone biosynthesis C-methylase UbiE/uncharacterized protein YbaR (Trm112 family)
VRESVLKLLACPACQAADWSVTIQVRDALEIREGELRCRTCASRLPIRQGVVHALPAVPPKVAAEIQGWIELLDVPEKQYEFRDEWILALPFLQAAQTPDRESIQIWRAMGQHVFSLLDRFAWQGQRVLEIGAGRCWVVAELARRGAAAVGLDILTHKYLGLETADIWMAAQPGLYFERVLGDMNDLPFQPEVFDFVIATASLHHTETLEQAMREAARVIRPQGHLLLINEPLVLLSGARPDLSQSPEVLHHIIETRPTYNEWTSAFEAAQLGIQQIHFADGLHVALKKGVPHAGLRRFRVGRQAEAWIKTAWSVFQEK